MHRFPLRIFTLTLCCIAATAAQQQAPFKSSVALVTVDVTVFDKDGKPVPGLAASDFEVKLGGKVQPVRAAAFVQTVNAEPAASSPAPAATPAAPKPVAPAIVAKEVDIRRAVSNQDDNAAATNVAAPEPASRPATSQPAAAAAPPHQNESRTFVLLVDDLSFTAQNGKKLFAAAERFVDSVPAADPVGITVTSGTATVNPTMNRAAVKAALGKVVGEWIDPRSMRKGGTLPNGQTAAADQPVGMDEAIDIDRGDDTLLKSVIVRECYSGNAQSVASLSVQQLLASGGANNDDCPHDVLNEAKRTAALLRQLRARQMGSLTAVLNAMRSVSGIRHLVYITDGMAVQRDVSELQPLIRTAAASGVQLSVMMEDPDGVNMNATGRTVAADSVQQADPGMASRMREDNRLMVNGAQTLADTVGGIFYKVVGEADTAFARILTASSAVYRLGVELPSGTSPGKELSLSVSLKRSGFTVRANKFAVPVPSAEAHAATAVTDKPASPVAAPVAPSTDDLLKQALNENRVLRGVPIRLGAMIRRSVNADGQIDLSVHVRFPPSVKTPVTALIGIVDEANAIKVSRRVIDSTANPVQFLFPLPPGSYAVRFAAAGADGALGTIELPIAVKLHAMGAFNASDVLMFAADAASKKATLFSLDDVPPAAAPLSYFASIELYPPGAMPAEPPTVRWTIVRDGETQPIVDENNDAGVGGSLFRSDFELPFGTLPPGTYIVRATLMAGDRPAGTIAATLRKQ